MLAISHIVALTIAPLSLRDTVTMATVTMAEAAARKAIELDPDEPSALTALARVAEFKGDREAALELAEQAILVDPNYAGAHIVKGANLIYSGRTGEGREAEMAALRLNPRDPLGLGMRLMVAISYYYERDYHRMPLAPPAAPYGTILITQTPIGGWPHRSVSLVAVKRPALLCNRRSRCRLLLSASMSAHVRRGWGHHTICSKLHAKLPGTGT